MGYRTQLRINTLRDGEIPQEGEPFWDPIGRRLGFWNFQFNKIQWFRVPGEGENENYVPEHQWEDNKLSFKQPNGQWGEEVDLTGAGISNITSAFDPTTAIMTFIFTVTDKDGTKDYVFGTNSLKGPPGDPGPAGSPPIMSLSVDDTGNLIFSATYGNLEAVNASINENGELLVTYSL